jgi:hypothetical protein
MAEEESAPAMRFSWPLRFPKQPHEIDDVFIERVMQMWDQKMDTYDMARILFRPEASCEVALWRGREKRRRRDG